jgi:hypothetical protein
VLIFVVIYYLQHCLNTNFNSSTSYTQVLRLQLFFAVLCFWPRIHILPLHTYIIYIHTFFSLSNKIYNSKVFNILLNKLQYSTFIIHAKIHLNMPSVWAPCNLRTSSESVDWTQGSFRCGNRSFCKAITSRSVLPNILGRKICSWNNMHKSISDRDMSLRNQATSILHKMNMYSFQNNHITS